MDIRKNLDDALALQNWLTTEVRALNMLVNQEGNSPELQAVLETLQETTEEHLLQMTELVELNTERLQIFGEEAIV